ncbi:hypothetical protein B0H14DRAFT_2616901 [Mycena olivaceomarginata]|nr:hypothetical protein B0H14DRAFT_2616901 [Mycena olivaceomarginata]
MSLSGLWIAAILLQITLHWPHSKDSFLPAGIPGSLVPGVQIYRCGADTVHTPLARAAYTLLSQGSGMFLEMTSPRHACACRLPRRHSARWPAVTESWMLVWHKRIEGGQVKNDCKDREDVQMERKWKDQAKAKECGALQREVVSWVYERAWDA